MNVLTVTVNLPVSDLAASEKWYRQVFDDAGPSITPVPGIIEFVVGPVELQLSVDPVERSGASVIVRFGVDDAPAAHQRMSELGIAVGELEHVENVVDYFDFADPDGNQLSIYSMA
ncbi:MAG TPA: VOC family protein [Glaciihabitans sp.]|jgi:predicted enzyme related to lactoylglutathione lyase|nr:VOC family protein [Glaciihabitans sp.]